MKFTCTHTRTRVINAYKERKMPHRGYRCWRVDVWRVARSGIHVVFFLQLKNHIYKINPNASCRKCFNNLENTFKLSKSVKEFRGQILRWNGPLCRCQTCILCKLNDLCYNERTEHCLESVTSRHVLRIIFV